MNAAATTRPVVVLGAGPTGLLCALMLARQHIPVVVFERSGDPRSTSKLPLSSSHNVALSTRGVEALRKVDLAEVVLSESISVRGRKMHSIDGNTTFQEYGVDGQCTYALPRDTIRNALLDAAVEHAIDVRFDHECVDVDLARTCVRFAHDGQELTLDAQLIIGADGATSRVRRALMQTDRFDYSQHFLDYGYQEVTFSPKADGSFALDKHSKHVWPRHEFVLTALPNPDGTFTGTLFLPYEGEHSFASLTTSEAIEAFFQEQFPDAWGLISHVGESLLRQQPRSMCSIRCHPLHRERTLLIGDAAHAMAPFYGQGLNCSLEDCEVLAQLVAEHGANWERVLPLFSETRRPDLDAIADLALGYFRELRSLVARPSFLWRKRLEKTLHRMMPDHFIPLYSMITFSTMRYSEARRRAARQEEWLLEVISSARTP